MVYRFNNIIKTSIILFGMLLLCVQQINAQANLCNNATPFCTGTNYSFPGSTNAGQAQTVPY